MGRRFLTYTALTLGIAVVLSCAYYYLVCHGLRETKEYYPGRLNCILYDTTAYDAVFMGGSRAANNIDPLVFDSVTHLRSYNAGIEGVSFSVLELLARKFISHHHPRYLFINLDFYTLEKENSLWNFPQYYAHLDDPDIAALSSRKPALLYGRYMPFIAVSFIGDYLKGIALDDMLHIYPDGDFTYLHRGFSQVSSDMYHGPVLNKPLKFSYDTANFKKLDDFCDYCSEQHCQVVFIMAPVYGVYPDTSAYTKVYDEQLKKIESKHHIHEFNFYFDARFTKNMFADMSHMNSTGAVLYSRLLGNSFNLSLAPTNK